MRQPLSVFIICVNEEDKIRRCLQSVAWCDEIIVVDSGSTDRTLEICKEFTDKIYFREWTGYVDQKSYALSLCTHQWTLNIDADEEVSSDLRRDIEAILSKDSSPECGYYVPRVVYFLGRWWRQGGWYPERRVRLFKRSCTKWGGSDPHERAIVSGKVGVLSGELYHYTYENLTSQIGQLNRFSLAMANDLKKRNRRFSIIDLCVRPIARFFKYYFFKFGFRDGLAGFIVAINESFYVFSKYSKLWEIEDKEKRSHDLD